MRLSFAKWMPIQRNFTKGGMALVPRGLAVHITDGVKGSLPNLGGIQAGRGFPRAGSAHDQPQNCAYRIGLRPALKASGEAKMSGLPMSSVACQSNT